MPLPIDAVVLYIYQLYKIYKQPWSVLDVFSWILSEQEYDPAWSVWGDIGTLVAICYLKMDQIT